MNAQTAVERELVLRLASLLWRLRRATAIETGLFKAQARYLLQVRQRRHSHRERQKIIDNMYRNVVATKDNMPQDQKEHTDSPDTGLSSVVELADHSDDLTRAFGRLNSLPTCPLDRLSRY